MLSKHDYEIIVSFDFKLQYIDALCALNTIYCYCNNKFTTNILHVVFEMIF